MAYRLALLALPLLLVGCGGSSNGSSSNSASGTAFGESSLDLAIAHSSTAPTMFTETSMTSTGDATGHLTVVDSGTSPTGTVEVSAVVTRDSKATNQFFTQNLTLHLVRGADLVIGSRFDLADGASNGEYVDAHGYAEGPIAGDGFAGTWVTKGGTVEVTELSGGRITLKLTSVALDAKNDVSEPLTFSGTISGKLES